jgi:hypothetical protein
MKASYQAELRNMTEPQLTARTALPGIVLLTIMLAGIAALVRSLLLYEANRLTVASWLVMIGAFAWIAYLIVVDLINRRHRKRSVLSISEALYSVAGLLTLASLIAGRNDPGDPASTFDVIFVFVLFFTCAVWTLQSRLGAAELAAKEQMLRIEYRLADLVEQSKS